METVLLYFVGAMGLLGAVLFVGTFFMMKRGNESRSDVPLPGEEPTA